MSRQAVDRPFTSPPTQTTGTTHTPGTLTTCTDWCGELASVRPV